MAVEKSLVTLMYFSQLHFISCFSVNIQSNLHDTISSLAIHSSISLSSLTHSPASGSLDSRFHHLAVEGRGGLFMEMVYGEAM